MRECVENGLSGLLLSCVSVEASLSPSNMAAGCAVWLLGGKWLITVKFFVHLWVMQVLQNSTTLTCPVNV